MAHDSTGDDSDAARASASPLRAWAAVATIPEWGRIVLAWNDDGLMLLGPPDRAPGEHLGRLAARGVAIESTNVVAEKFLEPVTQYFAGDPRAIAAMPVVQPGTEFQRSVWQAVRGVPAGETRTFGVLARSLGRSDGGRAVGAACAANLAQIAVPTHRMLGQNGALTGTGAALKWNQRLLEHDVRCRARRDFG